MKKTWIFVLLLLTTPVLFPADNFTFTLYCDYLSLADSYYQSEYGGKKFLPEAKLTFRIRGNFYLWGSGGWLPAKYTWNEWSNKGVVNSDIEAKNTSQKLFFSGGLGYYMGYRDPSEFSISAEIGFSSAFNTIEISAKKEGSSTVLKGDETKESGIGIRGNLGITYGLIKNIFAEASFGYMYIWDKRDDGNFNAGGLRLALGLGMKF